MSTLKTSNIQDTSGNNNSTPEQINQGRAKAWARIDQDANSVVDGFNVASMTDIGTGRFSVTFTNAMPNANYAAVALSGNETGNTTGTRSVVRDSEWTTTTAAFRVFTGSSEINDDGISVVFFGD